MDERLTQEQRELVEKNLTVIDCVIRSCVHANNNICGMEYDDLYQIGAIGLCKAASRYKQSKQAAFSTYAFHVVKNTIIDYLRGLNTRLRAQNCFLEESEQHIKQQYMSDTEGNDIAVSKTELDVFLKIVDKLFENAGDTYHQDSYDT